MANKLEKSTSEQNICLQSNILPTKQVKKVDEHLTIEFTDIKQEPLCHTDNYQKFQEVKKEIKSKCISCDICIENAGYSDGMATIHETCFQKLCTRLYVANDKVQDLEVSNKNMTGCIEILERSNKELSEKLKELQEITKEKDKLDSNLSHTKLDEAKHEFHKSE